MPVAPWPELDFKALQPTLETLHQWTQIVGKIRLRTHPWQNHSWHVTLYVTPYGLSTQAIPMDDRTFQIDFDFQRHQLFIVCSSGYWKSIELRSRSVADFHDELFEQLHDIGIDVTIHGAPNEMEPAIPFREQTAESTYDPEAARTLWQTMQRVNLVFQRFRSDFTGKCSPVHLFWGAFDLAVTRFSGRPAPLHPGGMPNMPLDVMQEAYSQEVSSAGFWPGSADAPEPIFYAYAYPSADDFKNQTVEPASAYWHDDLGEFVLPYAAVQHSADPAAMLRRFLETTYEAAARTSEWPVAGV